VPSKGCRFRWWNWKYIDRDKDSIWELELGNGGAPFGARADRYARFGNSLKPKEGESPVQHAIALGVETMLYYLPLLAERIRESRVVESFREAKNEDEQVTLCLAIADAISPICVNAPPEDVAVFLCRIQKDKLYQLMDQLED